MKLEEARLTGGLRLYAIGDIHGCFEQLDELLQLVLHDLRTKNVDQHKIVFLGDYVDRGPDNKKVLQRLIELQHEHPEFVFLMGNHDERMIAFIENPALVWDDFLKWGGVQTLESYGVIVKPGEDDKSIAKRFAAAVPVEHLEFLKQLKFRHEDGDYFFCHAGVRPGVQLYDQSDHDLIWIRNDFLGHKGEFEKVVVHGHTPKTSPEVKNNRINVDTRCYETGVLSALVLEDSQFRFLQTKGI